MSTENGKERQQGDANSNVLWHFFSRHDQTAGSVDKFEKLWQALQFGASQSSLSFRPTELDQNFGASRTMSNQDAKIWATT